MSRLFDPLGLLGPIFVIAKLIIQELWQLEIHWDESILPDIDFRWRKLKSQLFMINKIKILRCVKYSANPQCIQLHGFADVSQKAYGACVYIRTQIENNEFCSELLCAKSRVAPVKTLTLPKLELSAGVLLAQLIDKIKKAIDLEGSDFFMIGFDDNP